MTKEEIIYRVRQIPESIRGLRLNTLRDGLQATILKSMETKGFFKHHSFMGGSALRFLFRHPRFSEGLNFSSTRKGFFRFSEALDFERIGSRSLLELAPSILKQIRALGFEVGAKHGDGSEVEKVSIQFQGILKEAGLSGLATQNLNILIESDSHPPSHHTIQTSLVKFPIPIALRHHDLPTLMAGKVAALIFRPFVKARDWYDWLWYANKPEGTSIEPNLAYLQSAIDRNADISASPKWDAADWRGMLKKRIETAVFPDDIGEQIAKYLEHPEEASLLTRDNFLAAVADTESISVSDKSQHELGG